MRASPRVALVPAPWPTGDSSSIIESTLWESDELKRRSGNFRNEDAASAVAW